MCFNSSFVNWLLGRPLETSEGEQLRDSYEVSSEQSIPSSTPPTNQIGKSCSFDKESDRYVCTDSVPHELEEVCSPDDPKCLTENIQDLKSTKNDSKTKPCNVGLNAYCSGLPMPNGKRNNFEISEKLPDQERLLCNYHDAICLLRNRKALRTLNRLKRKLDLQKLQKKINTGNTGLAHDCSPSNNDSRCKRSTESTSIKVSFVWVLLLNLILNLILNDTKLADKLDIYLNATFMQ